jgi:hypothetical protein
MLMKKTLFLLLAAFLLISAACGKNTVTPPGGDATGGDTTPTPTAQETPDVSPSPTQSPSQDVGTPEPAEEGPLGPVYTDTVTIEGMPETVSYALVKGSYGYTMPVDVDRFEFISAEGKDYFICALNEHVWLSVEYAEAETPEAVLARLPDWPEEAVVSENDITITENEYPAKHVHAVYGTSYDSTVMDVYIIDDGAGGSYIITHCYFLEGAEGWGARLYYMTEDFVIEKA